MTRPKKVEPLLSLVVCMLSVCFCCVFLVWWLLLLLFLFLFVVVLVVVFLFLLLFSLKKRIESALKLSFSLHFLLVKFLCFDLVQM